ncbi:hypothetical protein V5O48_019251, partial [Marasmius crinis-equi]
ASLDYDDPVQIMKENARPRASNSSTTGRYTLEEAMTDKPNFNLVLDNPNRKWTSGVEPPPHAKPDYVPFVPGTFPIVRLSLRALFANVDTETIKAVVAHPDQYIAVRFLNGGSAFFARNPDIAEQVTKWLVSCNFDCEPFVARAEPRGPIDPKREFQPPNLAIISCASDSLRSWLIKGQTFIINKVLAFHALKFDLDYISFVTTRFTMGIKLTGPTHLQYALATIKAALYPDPEFRRITLELTQNLTGRKEDDRIRHALSSFYLELVDADLGGNPAPYYLLTAKPLTTDHEKHDKWLETINRRYQLPTFAAFLKPFPSRGTAAACSLCNSDLHHVKTCTLPTMERYNGPGAVTAADEATQDALNCTAVRRMIQENPKGTAVPKGKGKPGRK